MPFTLDSLHKETWFQTLPSIQRELLTQSLYLVEYVTESSHTFFDYSFVVMPAAKAYEGFIKDLLLQFGLISQAHYEGKRFRVGKALNPEIARQQPNGHDVLYDDLARRFGETAVPAQLWKTWQLGRNQIFHYFHGLPAALTLGQARERVELILTTIEATIKRV